MTDYSDKEWLREMQERWAAQERGSHHRMPEEWRGMMRGMAWLCGLGIVLALGIVLSKAGV